MNKIILKLKYYYLFDLYILYIKQDFRIRENFEFAETIEVYLCVLEIFSYSTVIFLFIVQSYRIRKIIIYLTWFLHNMRNRWKEINRNYSTYFFFLPWSNTCLHGKSKPYGFRLLFFFLLFFASVLAILWIDIWQIVM